MQKENRKRRFCGICLFIEGGLLYNLIECLWRGRTHWSMFLVGGVCFRLIGGIYKRLSATKLLFRCLASSAAVTAVEFLSGCYFNLHLRLAVWDYTNRPLNLCGQVCLLYSVFWGLLSIPAGKLYIRCENSLKQSVDHYFSAEGHR